MPRSPISQSAPPGSCARSSASAQRRTHAAKRSPSKSAPKSTLSRTVALSTQGTCAQNATAPGASLDAPAMVSISPAMAASRLDLPLPTGPTTPTSWPGATARSMRSSASGSGSGGFSGSTIAAFLGFFFFLGFVFLPSLSPASSSSSSFSSRTGGFVDHANVPSSMASAAPFAPPLRSSSSGCVRKAAMRFAETWYVRNWMRQKGRNASGSRRSEKRLKVAKAVELSSSRPIFCV
mmetsp:Transcript_17123/g.59061  ORF Transcript_17123/g.59061 Transcript_17123/m.59061 type:complete len:236 (+) Transcript_17123:1027-1734(+)